MKTKQRYFQTKLSVSVTSRNYQRVFFGQKKNGNRWKAKNVPRNEEQGK